MQQGSEFASFKGSTVQVSQPLQMPTVKTEQKNHYRREESTCSLSVWQLLKNEINLKFSSLASLMGQLSLKLFSLQLALTLACHHPDTNVFRAYFSSLFKSSTVKSFQDLSPWCLWSPPADSRSGIRSEESGISYDLFQSFWLSYTLTRHGPSVGTNYILLGKSRLSLCISK